MPTVARSDALSSRTTHARRRRSTELQHELADADILRRTGSPITQQSVGPTIRWLARHEPEAMAATAAIVGSYDAMVSRLTGQRSVELNWAVESGLFDLETQGWALDVLAAVGLDASLLPPVRKPAEVVGEVSASAAQETGLRAGTPVDRRQCRPRSLRRSLPVSCKRATSWSSWEAPVTSFW